MIRGGEGGERGWLRDFFGELRRRRVLQVGATYVGVFFVLSQAASIFFPVLHLPDWTVTWFVAVGILGFPLVIGLAWAFDLTREGIVRTEPLPREERARRAGSARSEAAGSGKRDGTDAQLSSSDWGRVHRLFNEALELPPAERESFLDEACLGNLSLRGEVESLLHSHGEPGPVDRLSEDVMEPLVRPLRSMPGSGSDSQEDSVRSFPSLPADTAEGQGLISGRYEIRKELDRGGMGVVFHARDVRLDREVALKFLPRHLSAGPESRRRFLQEARAAAALDHPNICTVHEIGEAFDGGLFIAMPLYEGETLKDRLVRGSLEWTEALDIATQAARGLERAHETEIVHRDVKPGNLFWTKAGIVKILDFGIAKVADATMTGPDAVLGTAAYMSPEQARGEAVDGRTDLWSLGVVLFEMLTGERLFASTDHRAVVAAIRSDEPLPLGRLRGTAPVPLIRVVERLLTRSVPERTPSAGALLRQLEGVRVDSEHEDDRAEAADGQLASEGERRQASVLVLRIAGYTSMLERVEPAELEGRMARLRSAVDDVTRSHGGVLNEFSGDRMIVVFGVPKTREDDLLRAVRMALDLHELAELGGERAGEEPLQLRVGIATGTMVVRPSPSGSPAYHLAGNPPELAARLASEAPPGDTWLDDRGARIAKSILTLESAGEVATGEGSGVIEAVRIGELPSRSDRPCHALQGSAPRTEYTGRETEMETLLAAWRKSVDGEGQFATVIGEAGIGKSRLLQEFRLRVRDGSTRVLQGQCPPHVGIGPYHPFVEVLHEILEVDLGSDSEAVDRVLAALQELDPGLERFMPFYLHLLTLQSDRFPLPRDLAGEQFRAGMREAFVALLTVLCGRTPTVLLLEDWHWVDDASGELLKEFVGAIDVYPLLVVVTARPGYGMEWGSSQPRTLVHLRPLDPEQAARLIRSVLGVAEVSEEAAATLHERSSGNPFFLEELSQSLREAGMLQIESGRASLKGTSEGLHLPSTIQGVIRTRMDRLPAETREVLRSAAVLGRHFSLPLLERVGPQRYALTRSLDQLLSLGILQQIQVLPERRFRFRHALTQEVAYDTLLQHQRIALHGRAGRAFVELYPERLEEEARRLAHHFSRAEQWMEAIRHGLVAARQARGLMESAEALHILEEVERWLSRLSPGERRRELEVEALMQQEEVCDVLGLRDRQQELLGRVAEFVEDDPDPRRLCEVYRRQGDVYTLFRRFPEAEEALDAALELARSVDDESLEGKVLRSLGFTSWHNGKSEEALRRINEALAVDRERGAVEAVATDLANKSQIHKERGEHEEAMACLEEAWEVLEEAPEAIDLTYAYHSILHKMGTLYRIMGDPERALHFVSRGLEETAGRHLPLQKWAYLMATASIHLSQGRIDEAVRYYRESMVVARQSHYAEGLAFSLKPLGEILAGIGGEEEAISYLQEAASICGRLGRMERERETWYKVGEVADQAGKLVEAREAWRRVLELAGEETDVGVRITALQGIARANRELEEDPAPARSSLQEALELARSAEDRRRQAGILNSLGILEWEQGEHGKALERYHLALGIYRELDDSVHQGVILNSLGVTLRALGRRDEARSVLKEALDMHRRTGERLLEGHALAALGDLCLDEERLERAEEWFDRALEVRTGADDRSGRGWVHFRLARVRAKIGRKDSAREHLAEARRIAGELDDGELLRSCEEVHISL